MSVEITIDTSEVDRLLAAMVDGIEPLKRGMLESAAEIYLDHMRAILTEHINTGETLNSTTAEDLGDSFLIGPNTGKSLFLDQDTSAHDIYPVNAQALRFELPDGTIIFAKHVYHPGSTGIHYVDETLEQGEDEIRDMMDAAIQAFLEFE